MQKVVADTREALGALTADEVNGLEGRDVVFQLAETKIQFVAEDLLMSFSSHIFYFHATTAYDILRSKGVPLGKRHFMGQLRMKR